MMTTFCATVGNLSISIKFFCQEFQFARANQGWYTLTLIISFFGDILAHPTNSAYTYPLPSQPIRLIPLSWNRCLKEPIGNILRFALSYGIQRARLSANVSYFHPTIYLCQGKGSELNREELQRRALKAV